MDQTMCYFTFPSTYQAIKAEKVLAGGQYEFRMVPVPRVISSSCGTALRCMPGDAGPIRGCLEEASVEVEEFYELQVDKSAGGFKSFFSRREKYN